MGETVTLPLWLVLLAALLAAVALIDRLLLPGARWFIKTRTQRLIEELNNRLKVRIPAFSLTRREVVIDRLVYDPQILAAIETASREEAVPHHLLIRRITRYAREIVPAFNPILYFRVGQRLARRLARNLYRVTIDETGLKDLNALGEEATLVYVMNHRSNMDYVLVGFLTAEQTAISYAVGEWARVWPLQTLIHGMGGYFVRRRSNDHLYRRVLRRYVQMAAAGGVAQAVFPEGGLSRDGALREARLGLLEYLVEGAAVHGGRDIAFVPVGINYDLVLEDRSLLRQGERPVSRRLTRATMLGGLRLAVTSLLMPRRLRPKRLGLAAVAFGTPIRLSEFLDQQGLDFAALDRAQRFDFMAALAAKLMSAIAGAVPALPLPIAAEILLAQPERSFTPEDLAAAVEARATALEAAGESVQPPAAQRGAAIEEAIRLLRLRRLVIEEDGGLRAASTRTRLLAYYANSLKSAAPRN